MASSGEFARRGRIEAVVSSETSPSPVPGFTLVTPGSGLKLSATPGSGLKLSATPVRAEIAFMPVRAD
jgi:hypothetical protein